MSEKESNDFHKEKEEDREINNSNYFVRLPIIFALTLAAGMFIGAKMFGSGVNENDVATNAQKIRDILSYIDILYVDTVDTDAITDKAIGSLLEELDPHSTYIPKSELDLANAPLQGNFEGVGIEFNIFRDTISVVSPIAGGPSEQVGIMAGDKIVKVDDEEVAGIGITNRGVIDRLRGEKGSKVKVGIVRKGKGEIMYFTITRDKIPTYTVDFSDMIDKNTGYIKVTRFGATTYEEFQKALTELNDKGMKNLILDLRDNGGGYMDRAINMADEFIAGKKMIVYTDGKYDRSDTQAFARFKGKFEKGPLIVLINENSASASEIVTGALQDHDRALVVGRRSFGKGLVQRPLPLSDGSELRLTISRYYTPSGRSIQKPYDNKKDYYMDYVNRYKHGEFFHADSVQVDESLKYKTSLGRTVYGGGGIIPDFFVPRDTSFYSEYLSKIYSANLLREYALNYTNDHKAELEEMTYDGFKKDFKITDQIIDGLKARAKEEGIEFAQEQFDTSKEFLYNQLKAYIARGVWKNEGFYPIILDEDEVVQKALKLMGEAKKLEKGKL